MKKKLALFAFLAALIVAACAMFAACGGGEKYTIKWEVEHATVVADGYKELPTSLAEGTKVSFTVTPESGYGNLRVTPANLIEKQNDGSYVLTVGKKDATIKVTATELPSAITVTPKDATKVYYAGDALTADDITVTLTYKKGPETTTNYTINYTGDNKAFAIGDTSYTVSFGDLKSDPVTVPAVVGKVTISAVGATLPEATLNAFKAYDNYTNDNGLITFTFTSIASDITLPAVEEISMGVGENFKLNGWKIGDEAATKIAAGTAVSLTAILDFEITGDMLILESVNLTTEDGVPYFIVTGTVGAVNTAYLFLYEGNDKVELKGDDLVVNGDKFTLKFDCTKLGESGYKGKWMDIRFRAEFGAIKIDQEIDLNDYEDGFINLSQEVHDKSFNYYYQTYTPGGTEKKMLKLVYADWSGYEITKITLANKEDVATLVIEGQYLKAETTEEAKEQLEALIYDIMDMSWSTIQFEASATVDNDFNFILNIPFTNAEAGATYFMHIGNSSTNFTSGKYVKGSIEIGELTYELDQASAFGVSWGGNLVSVKVTSKKTATANPVTFEVADGKVYLVITGTYENFTQEEFEAATLDFENGENGEDKTVIDASKITVTLNAEEGTYTVKADITEVKTGIFWVHWKGVLTGNGDVGNNNGTDPVECGDKTYSYADHTFDWGTGKVCHITAKAAE